MKHQSPGFIYRLLSHLLLPLWLLHGLRHGHKRGLASYTSMRFSLKRQQSNDEKIWVHASSVGEVQSIGPLVEALLVQNHSILFTSFTASGYETIQQRFGPRVESGVIPVDCWWLCRQFFKRPIKLALIMETELWPELLYQCVKRQIPLVQINARLSAKSSEQPAYIRRLLGKTLGYFDRILTRDRHDQEQLIHMGAAPERIEIIGNIKTVTSIDQPSQIPELLQNRYILLASSHEGEEQDFLQAGRDYPPPALVVIAPRHPERSATIQKQLAESGIEYAVRSKSEPVTASTRVYLADTLGELKSLMAHADIVVMGGSFDQTGGHNVIEPAALGCCIITGPSDSNIRSDIALLGNGRGILQVDTLQECWKALTDLSENPEKAEQMSQQALHQLNSQSDVIADYLEAVKPWTH